MQKKGIFEWMQMHFDGPPKFICIGKHIVVSTILHVCLLFIYCVMHIQMPSYIYTQKDFADMNITSDIILQTKNFTSSPELYK